MLPGTIFTRHNLASMLLKNGHQWNDVLNIFPKQDAKNSSWRALVIDKVSLRVAPAPEVVPMLKEVMQVG